jgi:hypothetical protein
MSAAITPAVQRATEQINAMLGPEEPKFVPNHARSVLNAALDVEELAEAMARRATPQYWSDEHRDMLLSLNPDETRVDEILDQMRQGQIARFRIQAADFRAEILGADS